MNIDEITAFREARPQVPPYDPVARARARARLLEGPARPGRAPITRRRLVLAGAFSAVLAAGVIVPNVLPSDGGAPGRSGPVLGPVANAEDLAGNAAARAAAQPDVRPRPDQWGYVKHLMASSSKGAGGALFGPPDRRVTEERWRQVDGTRSADIEQGRLQVRELSPMERNASPRSDYPFLLGLPHEPQALLTQVYKQVDAEGGLAHGRRAERAFQIIEIWMRDSALPPRLRAAMFGALARLPGVEYSGTAKDIAGRRGVTLYRIVEGYLRSEIIVNPNTYEYLGFRTIAIRDHLSRGLDRDMRTKKGQILGWGGLLAAAVVDGPGQRP